MRLRKYQRQAVRNVEAEWRRGHDHRNVLLVSPTGSGKSVMGAAVVKRHGGHVLWVAHRDELLQQARAELIAAGVAARDVGILSGSVRENEDARILVCSLGMARTHEVSPVDLVVVDEAHHVEAKSYRDILDHYDVPVLGMTATPHRMDRKPLGETFDEMVIAATVAELEDAGHVARPIVYGINEEGRREVVKGLKVHQGDYARGVLSDRMCSRRRMGDVLDEYRRHGVGRRTLVFASSREHGRKLLKAFRRMGVNAAYVDGETDSEERLDAVLRLGAGELDVLVNVELFGEGFDLPAIDCVIIARPTRSESLYIQQCGRALRPNGSGERPIICDVFGNHNLHGLPNAEREWSLFPPKKEPKTGPAPTRTCTECGAAFRAHLEVCPECGAAQPHPKREAERVAELERLKDEREKKAIARERFTKLAEVADMSAVKVSTAEWVEMMVREHWQEAV